MHLSVLTSYICKSETEISDQDIQRSAYNMATWIQHGPDIVDQDYIMSEWLLLANGMQGPFLYRIAVPIPRYPVGPVLRLKLTEHKVE